LEEVNGIDLAAGLAPAVGDVGESRQIMPLDAVSGLIPPQRPRIVHDPVNTSDIEAEELSAELTMLPP
jgi:hypothetical protein